MCSALDHGVARPDENSSHAAMGFNHPFGRFFEEFCRKTAATHPSSGYLSSLLRKLLTLMIKRILLLDESKFLVSHHEPHR